MGTAAVGLLVTVLGLAGCTTTDATGPGYNDATAPCHVPQLPRPHEDRSLAVSGPAVTSLHGGAARRTFTVDRGGLTVTPPTSGSAPVVTRTAALCEALAAVDSNNGSFSDPAESGGVAVGYGDVSVNPSIEHRAPRYYATTGSSGGRARTGLPAPPTFHDRLAWVVVVRDELASSCPAQSVPAATPAPTPTATVAPNHDYAAFILDARTGGQALLYTEGGSFGCAPPYNAPSAIPAAVSLSVPWTLVSRSRHDYAGTISATVRPCDAYPGGVDVDHYSPSVEVVVDQPVDTSGCGPPHRVDLSLDAANVTADLPPTIDHKPVGLVVGDPDQPTPGESATAVGTLLTLPRDGHGQTLQVHIGTVLTTPASLSPGALVRPARSSNPAVLGSLGYRRGDPVVEFRAWKPGTATITVPRSSCHGAHSLPPCGRAYVLHVIVS